jgi:hypothetical protein
MMKFVLTPGQRHDITQASILLSDISGANILADTVYDGSVARRFRATDF